MKIWECHHGTSVNGVMCSPVLRSAAASSFRLGGLRYNDITLAGFSDGEVVVGLRRGGTLRKPLRELESLRATDAPSLAEAEAAAAPSDASKADLEKACRLYGRALTEANGARLRLLIRARSVSTLARAGRWLDAVKTFAVVLEASPSMGTFAIRPSHLPPKGDPSLKEAAEFLSLKAQRATLPETRRLLRGVELEILLAAEDVRSADVASELGDWGTEILREYTFNDVSPVFDNGASAPEVVAIENTLLGHRYEAAAQAIDAALPEATDEVAIRLFALKAWSLRSQGNLAEAAASFLRIASHYPDHQAAAAESLWQAAQLQKELGNLREARSLYQEIGARYPSSPHATKGADLGEANN